MPSCANPSHRPPCDGSTAMLKPKSLCPSRDQGIASTSPSRGTRSKPCCSLLSHTVCRESSALPYTLPPGTSDTRENRLPSHRTTPSLEVTQIFPSRSSRSESADCSNPLSLIDRAVMFVEGCAVCERNPCVAGLALR